MRRGCGRSPTRFRSSCSPSEDGRWWTGFSTGSGRRAPTRCTWSRTRASRSASNAGRRTRTCASTATYLYEREHVRLVEQYLDEGNPPDQPGNYIAWLHIREPVYAYRFDGQWYDIGDATQLLEADNRMRRLRGLPERTEYSPS